MRGILARVFVRQAASAAAAAASPSSPVGREHDDRREAALQGAVQIGEALDVEHVDLVDEEDPWHELGDA